jgi:xylose isomerase
MSTATDTRKYFKTIGKVKYEGVESDNPFCFRWYDENKMVAGKSMKDHLRFACAYWHSLMAVVPIHSESLLIYLNGIKNLMR